MEDLKNRKPGYLVKQDLVYKKKRRELQSLRDELSAYRASFKNSSYTDDVVQSYNIAINKLSREYYSIVLSRFLYLDDSSKAIAYFLSKVYGVHYGVYEFPTTFYEPVYPSILDSSYNEPRPLEYNICFLSSDDKVVNAFKELNYRFKVKDSSSYDSYYRLIDGLKCSSDNYILLAYYKGSKKGKKIEYTYNNFVGVSEIPDTFIVSQLCDERYSCILDYIDKVIEYKLDSFNMNISFDDMIKIADNFDVKTLKK